MDVQPDGSVSLAHASGGGAPRAGDAFHKTLKKASLRIMVTASAISFVFRRMSLHVTGTAGY